jgi:hypothetical protein
MGGLATGLAGDMALGAGRALARGERPRLEELVLSPGSMERIADRLSQMRGAAMKLGQLMSMETGDLLPPELSGILARLRDEAHTMPPKQLKTVLETAYGSDFRRIFKGFDTQPLAAASIGQVHRATAADGTPLAIKIQYPGVRAAIDSDLDNAAALIRWSGMMPEELDLGPLMAEARKQLHEEADYAREGATWRGSPRCCEDDPRFVVPRHHPELSAPGALAMSYEPAAADRDAGGCTGRGARQGDDGADRAVPAGAVRVPHDADRPEFRQLPLAARDGADRACWISARRGRSGRGIADGHLDLLRAGLARDRDGCFAALEGLGFVRKGWRSGIARRSWTWRRWGSKRSTARSISPSMTCPTGCGGGAWRSATSGNCGTSRPPRRCFCSGRSGGSTCWPRGWGRRWISRAAGALGLSSGGGVS